MVRTVQWVNQYACYIYGLCALALLACIRTISLARRQRRQTIFRLERETALARESRAISIGALFVGIAVALTAFKFTIAPTLATQTPTPTPTATFFLFEEPPTREVPTATATPLPLTPTPRPTRQPTRPSSSPAATSYMPKCPQPGVCIRSPAEGARLSGVVQIEGSAIIEAFQFYKVEYGVGENPQEWHSIREVHRQPVADGILEIWDVSGFPAGVYMLRLTVVDITGNFGPPHEIRVSISP